MTQPLQGKTPPNIAALKGRTIKTNERGKVNWRPLNEVHAKLKEMAEGEGISQGKLLELAVDELHSYWKKYRRNTA